MNYSLLLVQINYLFQSFDKSQKEIRLILKIIYTIYWNSRKNTEISCDADSFKNSLK